MLKLEEVTARLEDAGLRVRGDDAEVFVIARPDLLNVGAAATTDPCVGVLVRAAPFERVWKALSGWKPDSTPNRTLFPHRDCSLGFERVEELPDGRIEPTDQWMYLIYRLAEG